MQLFNTKFDVEILAFHNLSLNNPITPTNNSITLFMYQVTYYSLHTNLSCLLYMQLKIQLLKLPLSKRSPATFTESQAMIRRN